MARRETGSVLIELTLVIPVILVALLATIELTRIFEATQKVATTSRETTNILHRNCYYAPDPSLGVWGPASCVNSATQSRIDLSGSTYNYMSSVLPGMEMLVSVYKLNQLTFPWSVTLETSQSTPGYNAINYPSRFQPELNYVNFNNNLGTSLLSPTKTHIIVVEGFHRYSSLLPLVQKLNILPSVFNIYEATIF